MLDMVLPAGLGFDQIKRHLCSLTNGWVLVGALMFKGLFQGNPSEEDDPVSGYRLTSVPIRAVFALQVGAEHAARSKRSRLVIHLVYEKYVA